MRVLAGLARVALVVASVAGCSAAGSGAAGSGGPGVAGNPAPRLTLAASRLTTDEQIVHALDRLAYGPRPGDLERVRRIGLPAYLDAQLHAERIADDGVNAALAAYPTLAMTTAELLREYPRPAPGRPPAAGARPGDADPREMFQPGQRARAPARIVAELQAAKLVRAVSSERQLQEVMVDFWFNHFNVYAQKGAARWMLTSYERDAIRPHALGRFRDLLLATARHPAMLFYLDNWLSVREGTTLLAGPNAGQRAGLNENYARELLELHTLGVDGGYTQADVVEVARCFTGWTIDRPFAEGRFVFRARAHDTGEKRVLGDTIPAGGGEADGVRVIDALARHPSTARFVAAKLGRRFVSDEPPPALVERAAQAFLASDGDIAAVVEAIVVSPEFFSPEARRAKVKTPLELVASAVRALDGRIVPRRPGAVDGAPARDDGGAALARAVARLGQPLYEAQPPTGYGDVAEAWVSTGALVARMNFALALAHGRYAGVAADPQTPARDRARPGEALDRVLAALLPGRAAPETRAVLARQLAEAPARAATPARRAAASEVGREEIATMIALVLGSPEFQRR